MTDTLSREQIKHMVDRFLNWKLPQDFAPDAGISFKADYNQNTPWCAKHEPVGTNLFNAEQAEAMVRHMVAGLPSPMTENAKATPLMERFAALLNEEMAAEITSHAAALAEARREGAEEMRERAARVCDNDLHIQHPMKPLGVAVTSYPAAEGHARFIRALPATPARDAEPS